MMKIQQAASQFQELGHEKRLEIFKFLVKVGIDGAMVSEIQKHLSIPASTLTHHISRLAAVGLIRQEKQGRIIYCFAEYKTLNDLFQYVKEECCNQSSC